MPRCMGDTESSFRESYVALYPTGIQGPKDELEERAWLRQELGTFRGPSETSAYLVPSSAQRSDCGLYIVDSIRSEGNSSHSNEPPQSAAPNVSNKRGEFDDGANALWSLYGKEAQAHDETLFQSLSADMDGVPTFVRISPRVPSQR